jgi:hypothetical protein
MMQTSEPPQTAQSEATPRRHSWRRECVSALRSACSLSHPGVQQACLILSIGLVCASGVAAATGYAPLAMRAGELRRREPAVRVEWPPLAGATSSMPETIGGEPRTWVPPEVRNSVERLALAHISPNPLDDRSLARAREALLRQGWFTQDLVITRDRDGVIDIRGTWRYPVAAVRTVNAGLTEDHLVASGGELLPLAYAPGKSGMKIVLGVTHAPPAPGEPWLGGEVHEALSLLALLRGHEADRQVAGIDVGNFVVKRRLELVTDRGHRVWWGGPLGAMNPGEVPVREKLTRLTRLMRDHGRVDADRAVVDIRTFGGSFLVLDKPSLAERPPTKPTAPESKRKSGKREQ